MDCDQCFSSKIPEVKEDVDSYKYNDDANVASKPHPSTTRVSDGDPSLSP